MEISSDAKDELSLVLETLNELFDKAIKTFMDRQLKMVLEVEELEEKIDVLDENLENAHIERLRKGLCTAQVGSVYLQTISHLDRIGDHINNFAKSIRKYEEATK
jgi:phosphate:Na+ symporter